MKKYLLIIPIILVIWICSICYSKIYNTKTNNKDSSSKYLSEKMFWFDCKYTSKDIKWFNNIKAFIISKDGKNIAFASKEWDKYYLFLNYKKIGKWYFDITNISLNYNWSSNAYIAIEQDEKTRQRKWKLIINWVEEDMSKFALVWDFLFSKDWKRFSYILSPNFKDIYVVDEKNNEYWPYNTVSDKQFSENSKVSIFKAKKSNWDWIYSVNWKESGKFSSIEWLFFWKKSWSIYVSWKKWWKIILQKNNKNISFINEEDSQTVKYYNEYLSNWKTRLVYNNSRWPEFDKIEPYYTDNNINFIWIKENSIFDYSCTVK